MTDFTAFDIPNVVALAHHLGKPIVFFDLETNGFICPTFGITEMGMWRVTPEGKQGSYVHLMDPENKITEGAMKATGIDDSMVKGLPNFSAHASVATLMLEKCLPVGFNIRTFDVPGLRHQLERYALNVPAHAPILDIRDAWIGIHQTTKGKLVEVADHYGCAFNGAHRAMADTLGCVHVLEAMIVKHGMDKILTYVRGSELPLESPAGASGGKPKWYNADRDADKGKARDAILKVISDLGHWNLDHALNTSGITKPAPFSFAMADLLQEGLVTAEQAAHPEAQIWLDRNWEVVGNADGRLKPMLEKSQALGATAHVDYIQLRVALLRRAAPPVTITQAGEETILETVSETTVVSRPSTPRF